MATVQRYTSGSADRCASMKRVHAVELTFSIGWAAFWIYWLVAAFTMKRGRAQWSAAFRIRIPLVIVVFILVRVGAFHNHRLNTNSWRAGLGLALFAMGLAFAIWARRHIGRNWAVSYTHLDVYKRQTSPMGRRSGSRRKRPRGDFLAARRLETSRG